MPQWHRQGSLFLFLRQFAHLTFKFSCTIHKAGRGGESHQKKSRKHKLIPSGRSIFSSSLVCCYVSNCCCQKRCRRGSSCFTDEQPSPTQVRSVGCQQSRSCPGQTQHPDPCFPMALPCCALPGSWGGVNGNKSRYSHSKGRIPGVCVHIYIHCIARGHFDLQASSVQ